MTPPLALRRRTLPNFALAIHLLVAPLLFSACGSSSDDDGPLVRAEVAAATGGTFATPDGAFRILIPAGALNADAVLTVTAVPNPPAAGANQSAASRTFAVSLGGATLGDPVTVELRADRTPVHPELGEVAEFDSGWQRLDASFYRASDRTVVSQTEDLPATLRVVFRSLQRASGPGVAAGLAVLLDDTFGNEAFFGGVLGLHTLLQGVRPVDAVALGVQVDLTKVPAGIVAVMTDDTPAGLVAKDAALVDPATTLALIQAGAVVGVKGFYEDAGDPDLLTSAGITCALCHVTVTPTEFQLTAGPALLPIGAPNYDGVPNAAMDAGAILALTPFAQGAGQATVDLLNGWGPGRFDVRALPDNPLDDGVDNPTDTPPLWNFVDLEAQGYLLGWDGLFVGPDALASQAEAVYDLVMHANGAFGTATGTLPPALRVTPPQALVDALVQAEAGAQGNDVTPAQKLLDLQTWMRSLTSPAPGAFDETKAEAGFFLFNGKGLCSTCHTTADLTGPDLFTFSLPPDAGDLAGGLHVPSLRGIARTAPYLHDGSLATLPDVVATLNGILSANLTAAEQEALVEYLKSL